MNKVWKIKIYVSLNTVDETEKSLESRIKNPLRATFSFCVSDIVKCRKNANLQVQEIPSIFAHRNQYIRKIMIGNETSIQDILNQGGNVLIQITADDLNKTIDNAVNKTRRALEADIAKNKSDMLLTAEDVMEKLSISRRTLYNWEKKKYLCRVEIGGKLRYKLSDVNEILKSASM